MSGLFDWHVVGVLSRTWKELIAPNPERFVRLFDGPSGQVNIPASVLESWHTELTRGGTAAERLEHVRFVTAYNPSLNSHPQITVSMMDEPEESNPLGFEGARYDGIKTRTMIVREVVSVDMYAHNPDLVRALHVVIRAIMMAHSDDFGTLGYVGLMYMGGGDLMPEEELMPGVSSGPQMFARRQRWANQSQPVWTIGAIGAGTPHVHAADVTVNSIQGGVVGDPTATTP